MSGQSLCIQLQQHTGIDTILHYTCRDRNLLSIQSDLLGASSIGLHNLLCVTGEPSKLGNYPDATAVFDVDSIGLVNIVQRLNRGLDSGSNSIGASTNFAIGVAASPGAPDIENELRRFAYKVEAGAEFAITQPVFSLRLLETFLERTRDHGIPVFNRLEEWLVLHDSLGFGSVLETWRGQSTTLNAEVRALVDGQVVQGLAEDVRTNPVLYLREGCGRPDPSHRRR